MKWKQEEIENLVIQYLREHHKDFRIKEAVLENESLNEDVSSWWIACEHENGDVSIMEDDQVLLLLQQKQGWSKLTKTQAIDKGEQGFVLEVEGS